MTNPRPEQLARWDAIGTFLARQRKEMFLSIEYCSGLTGLSVFTYDKMEMGGREFFRDISLGTARRICSLLNVDLFHLLLEFWGDNISLIPEQHPFDFYSRCSSLSIIMRDRNVSDRQFEEYTGWNVGVIRDLTRTPDYIESLPIAAIVLFSEILEIDSGALIGIPPSKQ